jgi:hypothetical protein
VFVDAIERLAAAPAPQPESPPAWGFVVRPLILAAAVPGAVVEWASRPDPFKTLRKRLYRTRKTASKRWQKSVVKPLRARR